MSYDSRDQSSLRFFFLKYIFLIEIETFSWQAELTFLFNLFLFSLKSVKNFLQFLHFFQVCYGFLKNFQTEIINFNGLKFYPMTSENKWQKIVQNKMIGKKRSCEGKVVESEKTWIG